MVTSKSKSGQQKGKVKVGKLKLNRETVKDLTDSERKRVKGGRAVISPEYLTTIITNPVACGDPPPPPATRSECRLR